jgi:RNA-directed DNA polymerase
MPTGPTATRKRRTQTRSLSERVRLTETLLQAWHAIRRNGETSRSAKTRQETKEFGADLPRKLRSIQKRLHDRPYQFARQFGATPEKAKGKGKRPLVIAPLDDRIVQRAILDVLQDASELAQVQEILETPTSIGGIRGRGVEHAINLIDNAYASGRANFVAGSDISGFFTKIPQSAVVDFIGRQTDDSEFVDLFARALKVDLANGSEMTPEDLKMFPTDDVGVAQGCPLSALAGNIALRSFDQALNGRDIICIRYIDDFILLGKRQRAVTKAFESAEILLASMGMSIYKPSERSDKAFSGPIGESIHFLGYCLAPGVYPPTQINREDVIASVRAEFGQGR